VSKIRAELDTVQPGVKDAAQHPPSAVPSPQPTIRRFTKFVRVKLEEIMHLLHQEVSSLNVAPRPSADQLAKELFSCSPHRPVHYELCQCLVLVCHRPKCLKSSRIGPRLKKPSLNSQQIQQLSTSVKHLLCGQTPGKKSLSANWIDIYKRSTSTCRCLDCGATYLKATYSGTTTLKRCYIIALIF
jgi:hypothetical protein